MPHDNEQRFVHFASPGLARWVATCQAKVLHTRDNPMLLEDGISAPTWASMYYVDIRRAGLANRSRAGFQNLHPLFLLRWNLCVRSFR